MLQGAHASEGFGAQAHEISRPRRTFPRQPGKRAGLDAIARYGREAHAWAPKLVPARRPKTKKIAEVSVAATRASDARMMPIPSLSFT